MIYEIYLEPRTGKWRVRITVFYFLFFSRSSILHLDDKAGPLQFDTYSTALTHCVKIGIPEVYALRKRSKGFVTWVNGEACHAQG